MIGNKYGKVIIIALINVCGVCIVYNNVGVNNTLDHVVDNTVVNKEYLLDNAGRTNGTSIKSDNSVNQYSNELHTTKVNLNTQISNSDSKQVHLMKNILSFKTKSSKGSEPLPTTLEIDEDEELKRKLLDDSEIDLYPPHPIIISSSHKLENKVNNNNNLEILICNVYSG